MSYERLLLTEVSSYCVRLGSFFGARQQPLFVASAICFQN